jgi:hypothetical protein
MNIVDIIKEIYNTPGCRVHSPSVLPAVESQHIVPEDVRVFYTQCGGVSLFEEETYSTTIVSPQKILLANPVILSGLTKEELESTKPDLAWSWYIIAECPNAQYITIDFDPQRLGRCYDSFWDRHPSDSVVIATSFTHLLANLLSSRGQYWYWLRPDFVSLGTAYR